MKHQARTHRRSILFADIVRSTELYERLGDLDAKLRVAECLERLTAHIVSHEGRVVKSMGDGLLCAFDEEEKAVWAALSMGARAGEGELEIKVGVHSGPVVEDEGDIFGDAVNTAARIAELAKPSEILLSSDMESFLPSFMEAVARPVPPIEVKGKREPLELLAIQFAELERLAEGAAAADGDVGKTMVVDRGADLFERTPMRLELRYESTSLNLDVGARLEIGRDPESGLRISNSFVSRHHARIEHRQGKFVLEDTSSNGTYLVPHMQSKIHLLREKAILHGNGRIYLGADPDSNSSEPIIFQGG